MVNRLIRIKQRTLAHPLGRPLLCAYPPCLLHAVAGHDRRVNDVIYPFCSEDHARNMPWGDIVQLLRFPAVAGDLYR